ncbi:helix-turn-helix domain-containing protein [Anaerobacillus sp. MEB173]|uniref:helix-turn-helix domain-containing protein n=1 Tax=Anaerobacillus sp. MEB173 TaxID=3383345 RepID=UPI003F90D407
MIKFKLNELLESKGKTMYWLSKESGVRPNTISQWVNGDVNSITVDTLDKLCIALECDISDLIEHNKPEEKTT